MQLFCCIHLKTTTFGFRADDSNGLIAACRIQRVADLPNSCDNGGDPALGEVADMIRIKTFLIPFAGLLVTVTSPAIGPQDDFRGHLKTYTSAAERAYSREDIAFFQRSSTTDYTHTNVKGQTRRKAVALAELKQTFDSSSGIRVKLTPGAPALMGQLRTVAVSGEWSMSAKGRDGKPATLTMTLHTRNTFKKVNGKWLLHKMVDTRMANLKMNGKPVSPPRVAPAIRPKN